MKKLFSLVFVAIFLISFVAAAPPASVFATEENINGLQVFEPRFDYAKAATDFNLHVHVLNISNGLEVSNTNSDCNLHIYNGAGSHIVELDLGKDSNGIDHELTINGGNFTNGMYFYRIYCNATDIGGIAAGTFEVTETGYAQPEPISLALFLSLFLILFAGFLYTLFRNIGSLVTLTTDVNDVLFAWIGYFSLLFYLYFAQLWFNYAIVTDMANIMIQVGAWSHVFIPMLAFIITFIVTAFKVKREKE